MFAIRKKIKCADWPGDNWGNVLWNDKLNTVLGDEKDFQSFIQRITL